MGGPGTSGEREIAAYSRDNNETYLQHPNFLGSATQDTNHLGNWTEDLLWYPWGQLWQTAGNLWEWEAFQEGDGDFKLAPHRVYDDLAGRWLTPDPLGGDPTNPQSLNRYAYVLNNPTSNVNPLGLCDPDSGDCPGGSGGCDPSDPSCGGPCVPGVDNCTSTLGCGLGTVCSGPVPGGGVSVGNGPPPVGPGGIGILGMGMGSGPLSGDYGVGLPPLGGGGGLPCDFGTCGGPAVNSFVSDNVRLMGGQFWMFADVAWPFLGPPSDPGMRALWNAGRMSAPVASPWALVAWYGGSAAAAIAPALGRAVVIFAANNPIPWKCYTSFAYNFFQSAGSGPTRYRRVPMWRGRSNGIDGGLVDLSS